MEFQRVYLGSTKSKPPEYSRMTLLSPSICELIGQFKRRSSLIGIYASLASSPFQTAGSKGRKEIIFVDQRKILRKKACTNLGLQQDTNQCLSVTNCALTSSLDVFRAFSLQLL